jgi:hypothetical protein
MIVEVIRTTCLLCNVPVQVPAEGWYQRRSPAAACPSCNNLMAYGQVPWPVAQMVFYLRCQVSGLDRRVNELEKDVARLYQAQEDLEQDLLQQ